MITYAMNICICGISMCITDLFKVGSEKIRIAPLDPSVARWYKCRAASVNGPPLSFSARPACNSPCIDSLDKIWSMLATSPSTVRVQKVPSCLNSARLDQPWPACHRTSNSAGKLKSIIFAAATNCLKLLEASTVLVAEFDMSWERMTGNLSVKSFARDCKGTYKWCCWRDSWWTERWKANIQNIQLMQSYMFMPSDIRPVSRQNLRQTNKQQIGVAVCEAKLPGEVDICHTSVHRVRTIPGKADTDSVCSAWMGQNSEDPGHPMLRLLQQLFSSFATCRVQKG